MDIIGDVSYIQGIIKSGHYHLNLDEEKSKEFFKLTFEEQVEILKEKGTMQIDGTTINEVGEILSINSY